MKMTIYSKTLGLAALVSLAAVARSSGQGGVTLPLLFGNTIPIVDEWGNNLRGSSTAGTGALVQIYRITSGSVEAPNTDGTPQPNNVPLPGGTAFIGHMVGSHLPDSGLFAISIPVNQPPIGTRLFIRVFNRPTIAESSFYCDSAEFTITSTDTYIIEFPSADVPLDTTDPSGIGFHNSWQKSLGPDPYNTDSDGDGMTDFEEWLAGTNPFDPTSVLRIEEFVPTAAGEQDLVWQSVAGRCYVIEFSDDLLLDADAFEPLHDEPYMAEGPSSTMTMDTVDFGLFRVRLVECPE